MCPEGSASRSWRGRIRFGILWFVYSWRMRASSGECDLCGGALKRNGTTSAGAVRGRCKACGASRSVRRSRPDVARRHELEAFLSWLLGKDSQEEAAPGTGRQFRRRTAWCWNVVPAVPATGQIHDEVQLDGIYLTGGWCCLIAIAGGHVIGWQWCDTEKPQPGPHCWKSFLPRAP